MTSIRSERGDVLRGQTGGPTTIRNALWPLLVFEAQMGLVVLLVLDPLLLTLVDQIVAFGGDPFVGNAALIRFVLSFPGFAAITVAALGTTFFAVAAFGGDSIILRRAQTGRQMSYLAVWGSLFGRLPVLLALTAWTIAAAAVLGLPVLAAAMMARRWLLSDGDFYFYLATRPSNFFWAAGAVVLAAGIAGAGGSALVLRFGSAIPICVTRPVATLQSLRLAAEVTRGRWRTLLLRLLTVTAGLSLLWTVAIGAMSLASELVLARWAPGNGLLGASAFLALIGAFGLATLATISRATVLLVLLYDRSAAMAFPVYADRAPAPKRSNILGWAAAIAVCAAIPAAAAIELVRAAVAETQTVAVTAHRAGSTRAPENTLAALRNAIAEGADVVEIDAQETSDGEVVLLHDTDLRRVAGLAKPVWEMRSAELLGLDVGSWFAPRFKGERIPTLRAFAAAARGQVRLNVELKDNGRGEDLAARVVAVLRETGVVKEAAVSSLDLRLLRQVRAIAPEIKLGLILATGIGNVGAVDVDFIALARWLATPAAIRRFAARGQSVHVWTLDDDAAIARAMLDGADNIITGDPARALRVRTWFRDLSAADKILLRVPALAGSGWSWLARPIRRPVPDATADQESED